jgi:hypothetical protein
MRPFRDKYNFIHEKVYIGVIRKVKLLWIVIFLVLIYAHKIQVIIPGSNVTYECYMFVH